MASILTPLKKIFPDPYIFLLPMTYHLRGISKFFSEAPIKTALLIPYLVRGFEIFLPEGLIFPLSRDLPLEGENFPGNTRKNGASHSWVSERTRKKTSARLIFSPFSWPTTWGRKIFRQGFQNTPLNLLASGGVPQEHPIPSPDKEVITTRQLNNRHRNRYDRARIWARRRCGAVERSRGRHTKTVSEGRRSIPISN